MLSKLSVFLKLHDEISVFESKIRNISSTDISAVQQLFFLCCYFHSIKHLSIKRKKNITCRENNDNLV